MYVELIAIPAITMPGSGVIIVGRNTACSAITCCRLMYCDTLSPHNVLVTQQTLPQNKTSRRREREREKSRAYFQDFSPRKCQRFIGVSFELSFWQPRRNSKYPRSSRLFVAARKDIENEARLSEKPYPKNFLTSMGGKNVDFYYVDLTKINFLRKINLLYHHSWFRSVIEDLSTFDKDGLSSVERNKDRKSHETCRDVSKVF